MIGLSTTYYATQGRSIYDSVAKITELGFDTVELGSAHAFEENIWKTLSKIRSDFPRTRFTIHNLFPPQKQKIWFNPAEGLSEMNQKIIDDLFEAAGIINPILVSIHPPILSEITMGEAVVGNFISPLFGKTIDRSDSIKRFEELAGYIEGKAKELKIRVAIENMDLGCFRSLFLSASDYGAFFNKFLNSGLLLDVGHALLCGRLSDLVSLDGSILELHLHDLGEIEKRGKWAHLPIKEARFFNEIRGVLIKPIPKVFEHGADVSEKDILAEKKLLDEYLEGCGNG